MKRAVSTGKGGSLWSASLEACSLLRTGYDGMVALLLLWYLSPSLGGQKGNFLHENYRTDNFTRISSDLSDLM